MATTKRVKSKAAAAMASWVLLAELFRMGLGAAMLTCSPGDGLPASVEGRSKICSSPTVVVRMASWILWLSVRFWGVRMTVASSTI